MKEIEQQHRHFDHLDLLSPRPSSTYSLESTKTTLWMGDLEPWMDEPYIRQVWAMVGEQVLVKLIRDKRTGISSGYAFVDFNSDLAAQNALVTLHGKRMPNISRLFRLNWASGGGIHDRKEDRAPEFSLFVGDLSSDVDETFLLTVFRQRYPSCHSAKVMTDPVSGLPRGYGFVRFLDASDQQSALVEMNGSFCGQRPMRVSLATPKNRTSTTNSDIGSNGSSSGNADHRRLVSQETGLLQQPTNTTVFVGGLPSTVSEDELRRWFAPYGEIVYVKIPPNRGCGFVQYVSRLSAELAIEELNGFQIRSSRIRLSWGRLQNDKAGLPTATAVAVDHGGASDGWYAPHGMANGAHHLSPPLPLFRYQHRGSTPNNTPSGSLMDLSYGPRSPSLDPGRDDAFGSFSPPGYGHVRFRQLSPPPPPMAPPSAYHHHSSSSSSNSSSELDFLGSNHRHGGRSLGQTAGWLLGDVTESIIPATTRIITPSSTWDTNSIYA